MVKLNLRTDRIDRIEALRKEDPIHLEKGTGKDCWWGMLGDGYFCGATRGYFAYGETYGYGGELSFGFRLDPKKAKVDPEKIPYEAQMDLLQCASEKLDMLPEFRHCRSVDLSGEPKIVHRDYSYDDRKTGETVRGEYDTVLDSASVSYDSNCATADAIRKANTPHYSRLKYRWLIADNELKIKELEEKPQDDLTERRIEALKRSIEEMEALVDDERARGKKWDEIWSKSIGRGFFFRDASLGLEGDDNAIASLNAGGVIIAPIHEFIADELGKLRKVVSEAYYVCAPPEARIGKRSRRLEYFDSEGNAV